jgi:ABC-type multidrug transport system fused ATPase/permease subunit
MKTSAWAYAAGIIRAHPGSFFGGVALYTPFFLLALVPGLIVRAVFDHLSGDAPAGLNVWTLIGLMIAVELSRFVMLYGGALLWNFFRYSGEALLKWNMMRWLTAAPGVRVLPGSTGEAVSRFRDDTIEGLNLASVWIVGAQVLMSFAAIGVMLTINALITLAVVLPLLGTVALIYALTRTIQRYRIAARETTAAVTGFIGETFGAVQAVKLAGAEERMIQRLGDLNGKRAHAAIRDLVFSSTLQFANANLGAVGAGFVLLMAADAMRMGDFTVGDFTLFASYLAMTSIAPSFIGQVMAMAKQSGVSFKRMERLMDGAPARALVDRRYEPVPPAPRRDPSEAFETLTVSGLTRRHPGSGRGIEDVDLIVRRGTFTVITGRVGSGKTTLLRALLGLTPADAGALRWNGELVADPSSFLTPPRCAYTPQAPRLFSETLEENIRMGAEASPAGVEAALTLAVFEADVAAFDKGLETPVGPRGVTLSGGQVQRAAAARMFVRDVDLYVFDDVSSALDVNTEKALWSRLFASGERTCLAVSHRREAFRRADQIIVLENGRVVAMGDLARLMDSSEAFQDIWRRSA